MVEQTMGWLAEIRERDGEEKWLELIETLRAVTEGKVRVAYKRPIRWLSYNLYRSSSKLLALVLRCCLLITTNPSLIRRERQRRRPPRSPLSLRPTCLATSKWRRTRPWNGERRPSSF
jgi:hypothetical protein